MKKQYIIDNNGLCINMDMMKMDMCMCCMCMTSYMQNFDKFSISTKDFRIA